MIIGVIGLGIVGKATLIGLRCFGYDMWGFDVSKARTECEELQDADIYFICTPETEVGKAIAQLEPREGLVVVRSTTPPGTIVKLQQKFGRHICHIPEFLREQNALDDFMFPDRIIIGECCEYHGAVLASLYQHFHVPIIRVSTPTISETVKIVSNAWLYTQIVFWNEVKDKCDTLNVPSQIVANAVTADNRISNYGSKMTGNKPGGRCLPKDFELWRGI